MGRVVRVYGGQTRSASSAGDLVVQLEHVAERSDLAAVMEAYDTNQEDLFGFALATTRNVSSAQEVVQESFLRLIQQHRQGRAPENSRAWLFRVCSNLVRSRFRRQSVADRWRGFFESDDVAEGPEPGLIRGEQRIRVRQALQRLPKDARVALMLSAEGFTGEQIARALDRSEGSTRTLLWRARASLRLLLADEELAR